MEKETESRQQLAAQPNRRRKRRRKRRRIRWGKVILLLMIPILLILSVVGCVKLIAGGGLNTLCRKLIPGFAESPTEVMTKYVDALQQGDYSGMYELLSEESKNRISEESFIQRNQKIYEGIDAKNIAITFPENAETAVSDENRTQVSYTMSMATCAGNIHFDSTASFIDERGGNYLDWTDKVIFPDLESTDVIRVTTSLPERGSIFDRDGNLLAGNGTASSVGLVPGKMEEDSTERLAETLGISEESIEKKLSASWVKEDSFVPIQNVEKLSDQELSSPTAKTEAKADLKDALLAIPGVMMQDTTVRIYPLGEVTAHITGYLQNISAEELAADTAGVYNSNSQIGKTGLEKTYEEKLRGKIGHRISIFKQDGNVRRVLAISNPVNGENVTTTIDSALQRKIYETYSDVESATVALNPKTGEVLALVNTPSYDANLFSLGITNSQWEALNNDPAKPLTNRFRSLYTPGSSMKPITGAIGLTTGSLDPEKDYGSSSSWQLDASWGNYRVTTLHVSSPANLLNAMILSDNVYYAKAAVEIGAILLEDGWKSFGFGEEIPFPISLMPSTYSTEDTVTSAIQLADSGYGQGEMQVNPVHMAVMYSAFVNDGDMIRPHLELSEETSMWKDPAISVEAATTIYDALRQVVSSSLGTGHAAYMPELPIAGKTGTAELKTSRKEDGGSEIGWFTSFTLDKEDEEMLLLCTMVEDVENIGGSGYVVRGSKEIYRFYYELDKE